MLKGQNPKRALKNKCRVLLAVIDDISGSKTGLRNTRLGKTVVQNIMLCIVCQFLIKLLVFQITSSDCIKICKFVWKSYDPVIIIFFSLILYN